MSKRAGVFEGGELWVRCPFCGDSAHSLTKAHFSVKVRDGRYHCHRCKSGGVMPLKPLLELLESYHVAFEATAYHEPALTPWPTITAGAGTTRYSALDRYHYYDQEQEQWDAFYQWDPRELEPTGIHTRLARRSYNYGMGYSWPSAPDPLISTPARPLRLVEGPYDVLYAEDVCVYGTLSKGRLEDLGVHSIILCPDGDIWLKPDLRRQFIRLLEWMWSPKCLLYLVGLEILPDGKDPDAVKKSDRLFLDRKEIRRFIHDLKEIK
jgi:hypothetical protein